MKKNFKNLF